MLLDLQCCLQARIEAQCSEALAENRAERSALWLEVQRWQQIAASGAGASRGSAGDMLGEARVPCFVA